MARQSGRKRPRRSGRNQRRIDAEFRRLTADLDISDTAAPSGPRDYSLTEPDDTPHNPDAPRLTTRDRLGIAAVLAILVIPLAIRAAGVATPTWASILWVVAAGALVVVGALGLRRRGGSDDDEGARV